MKCTTLQILVIVCCTEIMATSEKNQNWKDEIREKLVSLCNKDAETVSRILFYLDQEEVTYKDDDRLPPAWRTLKWTRFSDEIFKAYAIRLAEYTKRAEEGRDSQIPEFTDTPLEGHLIYEILRSLYHWWNNEISFARCVKNIIDILGTISLGREWGTVRTIMGSVLGPIGAIVGEMFGWLSRWLTWWDVKYLA